MQRKQLAVLAAAVVLVGSAAFAVMRHEKFPPALHDASTNAVADTGANVAANLVAAPGRVEPASACTPKSSRL